MTRFVVAPFVASLSLCCFAQHGFKPVTDGPVLIFRDKNLYAHAKGYWQDQDVKKPQLAGLSSSEITCTSDDHLCVEDQANMTSVGPLWMLEADHVEYKIDRWTAEELVAHKDPPASAICKLRITLRFDFKLSKVYWMQTLNEPINESAPKLVQQECAVAGMSLELRDGNGYLLLQ